MLARPIPTGNTPPASLGIHFVVVGTARGFDFRWEICYPETEECWWVKGKREERSAGERLTPLLDDFEVD